MKTSDRLLLHSLDAVTPGGLSTQRRIARAVVWAVLITSTHFIAFAIGYAVGRV